MFREQPMLRPYEILLKAGLRPTRQRLDLAGLIFGTPARHLTAKELYQLAREADVSVSLATVYNALNQFADASIIKRIPVDRGLVYFDTDINAHHHFYVDGEDRIIDVASDSISFLRFPESPEGYAVTGLEIVIHLRRRDRIKAVPVCEVGS
jgi:Fur family iron response transcriptional regulator